MVIQAGNKLTMSQRWDNYSPSKTIAFWLMAIAVVAALVIGFTWGGWVTGGTSRANASMAVDAARGELASAICVERFNAAPNAEAKLAELKAVSGGYQQRQFVEAGGWATMPGQSSPDRIGAQRCAEALAS